MQKDFKIGMALGLILTAAAVLWLSTVPTLSTRARLFQSRTPQVSNNPPHIPEQPNNHSTEPTTTTEQQDTRFHIVHKGDTLSDISRKYYGSANNRQKIFIANQSVIKDPNRLTPGVKLIIPD